jgi:dipeptidyl-peptidase-4
VVTGRTTTVWEDSDPEWVSHNIDPSFAVTWAPDGRRLAFVSNRGGWRQLMIADLEAGTTRPLTEPGYEVWSAVWSPDGGSIVALTNRDDRSSVRPWVIPLDGRAARLLARLPGITEDAVARGRVAEPVWSPDGSRLAFGFSRAGDPFEIVVADPGGDRAATVLFSAVADGFPAGELATMEAVELRARDGTSIPAVLHRPRAGGRRHPALVFHYGGWGQMARVGWGLGVKSRLFQYLVSRGYVVLVVDPRGSEGYGRAHAHGLYRQGGGTQADDLADAARYLRTRRDIDPEAIAIFGHSYGAYLALTAMLRAPDAFDAGVLLAGVFDFGPYGDATYARIRFGDIAKAPDVPDLQVRPALHLDRLRAPVLVYHGTNDFNAPISFSEQLIRELLKADREFDYAVYPGEPHDWERGETDRDFLRRTEQFLSRHLRGGARAAP